MIGNIFLPIILNGIPFIFVSFGIRMQIGSGI